jgi:hypothetical protein
MLLEVGVVFTEVLGRVYVGRGLIIRSRKHRNDRDHDRFNL